MYIYKVNDDGVTCAYQDHLLENGPIPDGWAFVPPGLENKPLFIVGGVLTINKPQSLIDEEQADVKIQKHIRKLAIDDLKAKGDLPANFKDKEDR